MHDAQGAELRLSKARRIRVSNWGFGSPFFRL